jgi:hypothetical protein
VITSAIESFHTRVNDPKTSAMVIVMQRCHQRDLSGHLLEKGNFELLCLPAEYEGPSRVTSIGFADPRAEPGELLWPERFGPNEIAELKINLGSYAAAGQLQQRPSGRRRHLQAALVPLFPAARDEPSSGRCTAPGWHADVDPSDRGTTLSRGCVGAWRNADPN